MPAEELDTAIVDRVRAGNGEAFRTLVERHQDRVFGVLLRLLGDRDAAEELAQETFVRAYAALDRFRGESRFGTWLIQIAVNLVQDRRRREGRRPVVVSLDDIRRRTGREIELPDPRPGRDPADAQASAELAERLGAALRRLPQDARAAFILKHVEGLSYEEISGATGVSVGALKVRVHRARRRLRELCADSPPGGRNHGRPAGSLSGR